MKAHLVTFEGGVLDGQQHKVLFLTSTLIHPVLAPREGCSSCAFDTYRRVGFGALYRRICRYWLRRSYLDSIRPA